MKNVIHTILIAALVISMVSIARARGAPTNEQAFTPAAVSVDVAPAVASVPPTTAGYDVICNLTTLNAQPFTADTSAKRRLSTTGAWRRASGFYLPRSGPQPELVLLA